jgi:hypothetical protein
MSGRLLVASLSVGVALLIIAYVISCYRTPYVICSECMGSSLRSMCRRCRGAGEVKRLGARIIRRKVKR